MTNTEQKNKILHGNSADLEDILDRKSASTIPPYVLVPGRASWTQAYLSHGSLRAAALLSLP